MKKLSKMFHPVRNYISNGASRVKNFILKHKAGIGACIVMGVICFAWWVLGNPSTTSIGEDITVGNNLLVNGDVGIRTTTPASPLEIRNSGGWGVAIGSSGTTIDGVETGDWSSLHLNYESDGDVIIANGGGNVGIGVTGPTELVHLAQSNSGGDTTLFVSNTAASAANNVARIALGPHSGFINTNSPYIQAYDESGNAGLAFGVYSDGLAEKVRIDKSGNVYIKSLGSGDVYSDANGKLYISSDIAFKENIRPIENALDKVLQMDGVYFDWKDNLYGEETQVGLIANDVYEVIPELTGEDPDGYKTMFYGRTTALLIEAIKEQQGQISPLVENIIIDESGNVGIGTANPGSYKLNVAGSLNANSLYGGGVRVRDWMNCTTHGSNTSCDAVCCPSGYTTYSRDCSAPFSTQNEFITCYKDY